MPRAVEDDVHSSFREFRNEDATCVSVQCIYCNQVRAKNTTRQRAHLLKCDAYRAAHPDAAIFQQAAAADQTVDNSVDGQLGHANGGPQGQAQAPAQPVAADSSFADSSFAPNINMADHSALGFTPNPRINNPPVSLNGTPLHNTPGPPRASHDTSGAFALTPGPAPQHHPHPSIDTPAAKKLKISGASLSRKSMAATGKPEIPLPEVHAAFEEFKSSPDDKTVSARCRYCNTTRAKNTSRQREHLLTCPGFQEILRSRIPANNLRFQFDEHDVASSLALPIPQLSLDFRLSIRVKPTLHLSENKLGTKAWVACVGGQWAGRWGKGVVLPGGQDEQTNISETATKMSAKYLLQTSDAADSPALLICSIEGWLTAEKEIMERLQDPVKADNIAANRYKFRVTMTLETSDNRYQELPMGLWAGSGSRRGAEIVYDFYKIN